MNEELIFWCEECSHFIPWGPDGTGECDLDQADAELKYYCDNACENFNLR